MDRFYNSNPTRVGLRSVGWCCIKMLKHSFHSQVLKFQINKDSWSVLNCFFEV